MDGIFSYIFVAIFGAMLAGFLYVLFKNLLGK